jgi:hypothetical protein
MGGEVNERQRRKSEKVQATLNAFAQAVSCPDSLSDAAGAGATRRDVMAWSLERVLRHMWR